MATKSVAALKAEVDADLEKVTGLVASPLPGDPAAMAPATRLAWLRRALGELNLPSDFLAAGTDLAARASAMRGEAVTAQQQAQLRRARAVQTLARDQAASIAEQAAEWQQVGIWLDTWPGHQSPVALSLVEQSARLVEGEISMVIINHAPKLWDLAAKKAAVIVAEVEALPKMPRDLWQVSNPAEELSKFKEHRSSWGVMLGAYHDFNLCFSIAGMVRDHLGYNFAQYPQGSTRVAMWAKNWRKELGDDMFSRLVGALRIRYAQERGWEVGLWTPAQVEESTAADKSFGERLRNLGSAVGINI